MTFLSAPSSRPQPGRQRRWLWPRLWPRLWLLAGLAALLLWASSLLVSLPSVSELGPLKHRVQSQSLPPVLSGAVVEHEDRRFYQHGGLDLIGLLRASWSSLRGGGLQGGSTLTPQLVKIPCWPTSTGPGLSLGSFRKPGWQCRLSGSTANLTSSGPTCRSPTGDRWVNSRWWGTSRLPRPISGCGRLDSIWRRARIWPPCCPHRPGRPTPLKCSHWSTCCWARWWPTGGPQRPRQRRQHRH